MSKYKTIIIDNERIIISTHATNPFESRETLSNGGRKPLDYENMTIANYKRALRRYAEKLYCCSIDGTKCKYLTLTLDKAMSWDTLNEKTKIFIECIRRYFGRDVDYIRAIEMQKSDKLHVHLIIIFPNEVPNNFRDWVKQHWKYGVFRMKKVYEPYGLIDYFTQFDKNCIKDLEQGITLFPANAKLITTSFNTGIVW